MQNPFTLTSGKSPLEPVERPVQTNEIIDTFTAEPLNQQAIIKKYMNIFQIEREQAAQMAELTKGYPFAFQVLGYLTWNNRGNYREVLEEYEQYLSEFVYDKN